MTRVGGLSPSVTTKMGKGVTARTGKRGTSVNVNTGNGVSITVTQKGKLSTCISVGGMRIKL